jgi:predicted regulator of Ras-like GTPase activity (Roadblock/LC7/MglB family)
MPFLGILKELVDSATGSVAATLMGIDGLAVQSYPTENYPCDIESIGVECGSAVEELKKASEALKFGAVEEVVVTTDTSTMLLRLVVPDYYIVLVLEPGVGAGQARFRTRIAANKVKCEL